MLAHTGDEGVEAINRLDSETVETLLALDATCTSSGLSIQRYPDRCLDEETITEAIRVVLEETDEDLSADEVKHVVRRLDSPDTEAQITAVRLVAETDDEGVRFIDAVVDLRKADKFDFDEGDATELLHTIYVYRDVSGKNVRDIDEIREDLNKLTDEETTGLGEALKERTTTDPPDDADPGDVKNNFKGADGELDVGTTVLESDKSIEQLSRTIRDEYGEEIVEIDIELESGDVIEVKSVVFTDYRKSGDYIEKKNYEKLEKSYKTTLMLKLKWTSRSIISE